MQMGRINRAHVRCCEEADLASLGWICVAEQRCTDAALVLDASTRVAAAAGSCLIYPHMHCVDDSVHLSPKDGDNNAWSSKEADLASLGGGSVTLSSYTQTQQLR